MLAILISWRLLLQELQKKDAARTAAGAQPSQATMVPAPRAPSPAAGGATPTPKASTTTTEVQRSREPTPTATNLDV